MGSLALAGSPAKYRRVTRWLSSPRANTVTQMYFPDDPLHALDPIFNGVPTEQARQRLLASYDHSLTEPEWALGYRWDIVVHGPYATPFKSREKGQP